MTNAIRTAHLEASVVCPLEEVAADVRDRRPDSVALFGDSTQPQREQLVPEPGASALRALHNAHVAAQESRLKDVGEALALWISIASSAAHVEQQQGRRSRGARRAFLIRRTDR